MNLLCPNCQKPLTVPEQYAGQPMRCPLCAGTFTVPALAPMPTPPPAAAPASAPPTPQPAPADVYGLKDAGAPPPVHDMTEIEILPPTAPGAASPPPPPRPPRGPSAPYLEEPPTFPAAPVPDGYQRKYTIWFGPTVLQYVAPVAVLLIFVLTIFFPWVGTYPGDMPQDTQSAWQAAFGFYSGGTGDPFTAGNKAEPDFVPTDRLPKGPGFNLPLIFYLVPLLLVTLAVTAGCLALSFLPSSQLPPAVRPVLPWRWGIVAALNLILLLFLVLQLVLGFSLQSIFINAAEGLEPIHKGLVRGIVSRTIWLDLVVLLHILAILAASLMYWLTRRGGRPAPRIDMLW